MRARNAVTFARLVHRSEQYRLVRLAEVSMNTPWHDGQSAHVHYTESGSMSDKYAAGAAMGLAVRLAELGLERFGVCQAAPCQGVFIDTSANRTRRYCSDRCTNRAIVTAFRARKRGEDPQE